MKSNYKKTCSNFLFAIFTLVVMSCSPSNRNTRENSSPLKTLGESQSDTGSKIPIGVPENQGTSSGGGGGFIHKNSKLLFEDTHKKLMELLINANSELFSSMGKEWNKDKIVKIFENIIIDDKLIVLRNGDDELFYDYGADEKGPWLKVLKPFFDYYSIVPIKGPKGKYYFETQTQIIIELLHELSHIILNHPKGEVTKHEVQKIEFEADQFANRFFTSLVSQVKFCSTPMNYDLFGLKSPAVTESDGDEESISTKGESELDKSLKEEILVWLLPMYSDRGAVLKIEDINIARNFVESIFRNDFNLDSLTYLRESVGLANINGEGISFPPAPRFDVFFNELSENEILWHTVIFNLTLSDKKQIVNISRYKKGFEVGPPIAGGGLIDKISNLEDAIWGSKAKIDFNLSEHKIIIDDFNSWPAIYEYKNIDKKILVDPRADKQVDVKTESKILALKCETVSRIFEIPKKWPNR